jgi:Flp pilus assembly protein TadG
MRSCGLHRIHATSSRLMRDAGAVAAVEFAVVMPFLLTLYLGSLELNNALTVQFKTALASRAVTDLTSQYASINNSTMSGILGSVSPVFSPYAASGVTVIVSQISVDSSGRGTIAWSDAVNGTAYAIGQAVTLPSTLQVTNASLIWGQVTYPYRSTFGYALTGTINISAGNYFYPRLSTTVTRLNS